MSDDGAILEKSAPPPPPPPVTVTETSPIDVATRGEVPGILNRERLIAAETENNPPTQPDGGLRSGKHRRPRGPRGPGLKWHKEYSEIDPYGGRVLLIDFAKNDTTSSHIRKVAAQEIYSIEELRRVYNSRKQPDEQNEPILRVIHVQNAQWANQYLLHKFHIPSRGDVVGTDFGFGRYIRSYNKETETDEYRGRRRRGRPLLNGKSWKVQYDPRRGVSRTSFGLDYMKTVGTPYQPGTTRTDRVLDESEPLAQLDSFDDDDEPISRHDVYVQRVGCYIQHKLAVSDIPFDEPDMKNAYFYDGGDDKYTINDDLKDKIPQPIRALDNGNVIIIFDNSCSGSIEDTLIAARRAWECRWRRLPFYLAFESRESIANDEQLALQCSKSVLSDIFRAVVMEWDGFFDQAVTHVSILEDKIYDQPADETRAPELWANSSLWQKVEKLVNVHINVMNDMKSRLHELTDDIDSGDNWLDDIPGEFERLRNLVTEDLVKPTESLISLLYQSVSIRDSRHSLDLGVSMWRLSWITFIFLPLTFIVGFFGMNVDTFTNNPSIKWYFIAAIPFMVGIVAVYFITKRIASPQRQTPSYQRGVYEEFFQEMATSNPTLWTRAGPRDYIVPKGRIARLKWSLIRWWLIGATPTNVEGGGGGDDVTGVTGGSSSPGTISRIKQFLSRRWTQQIQRSMTILDTELGLMEEEGDYSDRAAADPSVGEGLVEVAEILSSPAAPTAAAGQLATTTTTTTTTAATAANHDPTRLTVPGSESQIKSPHAEEEEEAAAASNRTSIVTNSHIITAAIQRQQHRRRRQRSNSSGRRSGGRNSGIMVEEEDAEWFRERGKEGKEWLWRKSSSERERERGRERHTEKSPSRSRPGSGSASGQEDKDKQQSS